METLSVGEVHTMLRKISGNHKEELVTHVFGVLLSIIGVSGSRPISFIIPINVFLNDSVFFFLSLSSFASMLGITVASFMYASIAFDRGRRSLPIRMTTSL
jgi:hypothetical protein